MARRERHPVLPARASRLVCLDDDSQGRPLDALSELELGASILQPEAHGLGTVEPRRSAHALRRVPPRAEVERGYRDRPEIDRLFALDAKRAEEERLVGGTAQASHATNKTRAPRTKRSDAGGQTALFTPDDE